MSSVFLTEKMGHSFSDANITSIFETCMTSDEKHLKQQIEQFNLQNIGPDFYFDDSGQNLLHILAAHPEFTYWDLIIESFVYLDHADSKLQTPLHVAISNKNYRACKALIAKNASTTVEDDRGINPIQHACHMNDPKILEIILEPFNSQKYLSANVHSIAKTCFENNAVNSFAVVAKKVSVEELSGYDEEGKALIHYAALLQNHAFLQILLERGVDANQKTIKSSQIFDQEESPEMVGKTALDLTESTAMIEVLLANGAKTTQKEQRPIIASVLANGPNVLHNAARDSNISVIKGFTGNVDIRDLNDKTPLIIAVEHNNKNSLVALLDKGANPNFYTQATSAYHVAAQYGRADFITEFQKRQPPNMSIRDTSGKTSTIYAIESESAETLTRLIKGQMICPDDVDQITELLIKIKDDNTAAKMAEALLQSGFPNNPSTHSGTSMLHEAIVANKPKLATVLLDNITQNTELNTLLVDAVTSECGIVGKLIKLGATPTIHRGRPLLHFTATHKTSEALNALVENNEALKSAVDTRGNNYLHHAALVGNTRAINDSFTILHLSANSENNEKETAIHLLTEAGGENYVENLTVLLDNGADPSVHNSQEQNILHIAAQYGRVEELKYLISPECKISDEVITKLISERDSLNFTPLEEALKASQVECGKLLTTKKAHPIFDSPITMESIKNLLSQGLSPDVFDASGTPLLSAAIETYDESNPEMCREMVKELLAANADPSSIEANGETPFHHAVRKKDIEICKMLMDAGSSFLIGRPLNAICEEMELKEIGQMIKKPLKRACAALELENALHTAARELRAAFFLLTDPFKELPEIRAFIVDMEKIERVMRMFGDRLKPVVEKMKPTTPFGDIFMYFVDAFSGLVNISSSYCVAKAVIDKTPALIPLLDSKCDLSKNHLNDLLIVPVQVMTRLSPLVEAVMVNTPPELPDMKQIQRAFLKFTTTGIDTNERQLIFESQKKLQELDMILTIGEQKIRHLPNDVLLVYDNFTRLSFTEAPKGTPQSTLSEWGLQKCTIDSGKLNVDYFIPIGADIKELLDNEHITVFLFRKFVLFGIMKGETTFRLLYSCRTCEVLWDFSNMHGSDSFFLWTPIGKFYLKIFLKNGERGGDFLKKQWKTAALKLYEPDAQKDKSLGKVEIVRASWVGKKTNVVHSRKFSIKCETRTEAREKIKNFLLNSNVDIQECNSPEGDLVPNILYDFITFRPAQGQTSDVLSDVEVK